MKCIIEINMNHDSFHPSWRYGLAQALSLFCSKLSIMDDTDFNTDPLELKLRDVNGVTVGTATIKGDKG